MLANPNDCTSSKGKFNPACVYFVLMLFWAGFLRSLLKGEVFDNCERSRVVLGKNRGFTTRNLQQACERNMARLQGPGT